MTKNPSKTLTFLLYCDATKNEINQIYHILHRSTYQPHLQNLPLPPLLTQTQNENFQLQNIPRIPVPDPRVELVSQPTRVQLLQPAPTPPPGLQTSPPPSLDPYPNPWIKKFTTYLKSPQITESSKTQTAPR